MVVVHHGGDTVKAVAVKFVLIHPPPRVGHQEAQRLPVACTPAKGAMNFTGNTPVLQSFPGVSCTEAAPRLQKSEGVLFDCHHNGKLVAGCNSADSRFGEYTRKLNGRGCRSRPTIVEAARVPHPVVAAAAAMEVHGLSAIKHVDAVVGVLGRVAVHNVHQHDHPQPVRLVDHELQLIRRPAPAACLQGKQSYYQLLLEQPLSANFSAQQHAMLPAPAAVFTQYMHATSTLAQGQVHPAGILKWIFTLWGVSPSRRVLETWQSCTSAVPYRKEVCDMVAK